MKREKRKKQKTKVVVDKVPSPTTTTKNHWVGVLVVAALACLYLYYSLNHGNFTKVDTANRDSKIVWEVPCALEDYLPEVPGCTPRTCKRFIINNFTTLEEVSSLVSFASTVMTYGGGSGGPTIFDVSSGALSKGEAFIDLYKMLRLEKKAVFQKSDFDLITNISMRIKKMVSEEFSVKTELYLTKPLFFSRMYGISNSAAKTFHDEYWHTHVDKVAYGTFVYTCLLYLSDYGIHFEGGQFVFVDKNGNHTIEPVRSRLSCFTSGNENPHYVAKVETGTRWALTIAFTCDPKSKAPNFVSQNKDLVIGT